MAELNREVLERVREELEKRPHIGPGVLHQLAQWIDPSLGHLSLKAFQVRYVLPVQHELSRGERRTTRTRKTGTTRQRRSGRQRRIPVAEFLGSGAAPGARLGSGSQARRETEAALPPVAASAAQTPSSTDDRALEPDPVSERDRIRSVFLQLARDFAEAETPVDIVAVFSRLDAYVDRVVGGKR